MGSTPKMSLTSAAAAAAVLPLLKLLLLLVPGVDLWTQGIAASVSKWQNIPVLLGARCQALLVAARSNSIARRIRHATNSLACLDDARKPLQGPWLSGFPLH